MHTLIAILGIAVMIVTGIGASITDTSGEP